jgi:hypothetical protein
MTREEKIREARRLRALGWTAPAIGRELGASDSTIRNWYLGGACVDCGAPVDGSNRDKSLVCSTCAPDHYGQARLQQRRPRGPVAAETLAFLTTPRRFSEIRDHLGITSGHMGVTLNRLCNRYGLIRRVARGVYVRADA